MYLRESCPIKYPMFRTLKRRNIYLCLRTFLIYCWHLGIPNSTGELQKRFFLEVLTALWKSLKSNIGSISSVSSWESLVWQLILSWWSVREWSLTILRSCWRMLFLSRITSLFSADWFCVWSPPTCGYNLHHQHIHSQCSETNYSWDKMQNKNT